MQRLHKYLYWYGGKMLEVGNIEFMTDGSYRVNDELVGGVLREFTGSKDKNGKEIYEGDVVKHHDEFLFKIDMAELDYLDPVNDEASDHTGDMSPDALHTRPNNFEIIGNIYENADLLTQ